MTMSLKNTELNANDVWLDQAKMRSPTIEIGPDHVKMTNVNCRLEVNCTNQIYKIILEFNQGGLGGSNPGQMMYIHMNSD